MTILHLQAELHEKMWGGSALEDFNYKILSDHTGEAWTIAAHSNGQSTVINGKLAGQGLSRVWQDHPELFGGHATRLRPDDIESTSNTQKRSPRRTTL